VDASRGKLNNAIGFTAYQTYPLFVSCPNFEHGNLG